jgi:hypothetical protein
MFLVVIVYVTGATQAIERQTLKEAKELFDFAKASDLVTFVQLGGTMAGPIFDASLGAAMNTKSNADNIDMTEVLESMGRE